MRPHYLVHLIILAAAVFFLASHCATAGGTVAVPPLTQVVRGEAVSIVIRGRIETQGTAQVTFQYPRKIISINGARGAEGFGFTCPIVSIVRDEVLNATTGAITFECASGATISSDTLMNMDITALAEFYPQSTGWLTPTSLSVNGSVISDAVLTGGLIELPIPEGGVPSEGITGIYPNPFALSSQFVFAMLEPGPVNFAVISSQGRNVMEIPEMLAIAGENVFDFSLQQNEIAQGAYLLRMITDRGVYFYSFMVLH